MDQLLAPNKSSFIMIFILLPFLTDALNVTSHASTDVKGRFLDISEDCEGKNVQNVNLTLYGFC